MSTKKRGLGTGRGLDALLGAVRQVREEVAAVESDTISPAILNSLQHLPLVQLQRGRYQPRRDMNPTLYKNWRSRLKRKALCNRLWCACWVMIVTRLLRVSALARGTNGRFRYYSGHYS